MAPRCPIASGFASFFSAYLFRHIRGQRSALLSVCGNAALDGALKRPLASVAGRVREVEIGLSSLYRQVRPGRLAALMAYMQMDLDLSTVCLDSNDGARPRPRRCVFSTTIRILAVLCACA